MRGGISSPPPRSIEELVQRKAGALCHPDVLTQAKYAELLVHLTEFARSCIALAAQHDSWEEALGEIDDYEYLRRVETRGRGSEGS